VIGIGRDHPSLQREEIRLSQYPFPPPPYSPPMVDPRVWAMSQPQAAGRAAALWQLVLGGLIFLSGSCVITAVWVVPDNVMVEAARQQQTNLPPIQNLTPVQEIRLFTTVGSGMMIVAGGLLVLLMFFVRRGGKISTILSIVLNSVIALVLLMNFVAGLGQVAIRPAAIVPLALFGGILALAGITIGKLVVALRSSGTAQTQAMQQAHYWMMQHQQNGGYGYGAGPGRDAPAQGAALPPPPPGPDDRVGP
jgi:hypothetical protein